MNRKSKLMVFILSPLPGLSHLYLGITDRALTFFILFMGVCLGGSMLGSFFPVMLGPFLFIALVVVWFVTLADAFAQIDGRYNIYSDSEPAVVSNRKIITIALSIIPGAGHMYLGLLKQGTQLMVAFFLLMFLTDWLQMSLLSFMLPVLWFYNLFDAYHLLEEENDGLQPDESPLFDWFNRHPASIGWSFIILGVLVVLQRIVSPIVITLLSENMRNYIETGLVALILIAGGIKMLVGNKIPSQTEDEQ